MADDPYTELREAYRQPSEPTDCSWEHQSVVKSAQAKNPKLNFNDDKMLKKWYKPKLNKYGEPKLYLSELDVIELEFALGMFKDIYINNIHNMKYKEKMQEAHWYADYALLICKNAAKSETERRYNEWRTNEIQQDSGKKPHDREQRGWYK